MKIVVTGGAGFIGSHLVDRLIKDNHKVLVIDNFSTSTGENLNQSAYFFNLSVDDYDQCLEVCVRFKPKFIFHLAALPRIQRSIDNPLDTHRTNVDGTAVMLEIARKCDVKRFIYASSSSVYGEQPEYALPLDVNLKPNPLSPYAVQKYVGELYCKQYSKHFGLDTVCLRYFNVYGPRQSSEGIYSLVIGKFLRMKKKGESLTVYGNGMQTRDYTFVSDVVEANVRAMLRKKRFMGMVLNIGTGIETSVIDIARIIGGKIKFIIPNPRGEFEEKRKMADIRMTIDELNGWKPKVGIEEGIKKCE